MTEENIISHSVHVAKYDHKELISIIHTEKGNTDNCFNTIIFNFREIDNNPIIKSIFDYNRRFDLKPSYFAEPFYNPDMSPPTREDMLSFLKHLSKDPFQ
tara:strand:- start:2410 stop:2709 length:300 start_codon:yes stop_codon:yes gene_type:complete